MTQPAQPPQAPLSFAAFTALFGRIGLLSLGGPAAQIALLHRETVERRQLVRDDEFLPALSLCMLLPGPEAMQLASWLGWRLRGLAGGILAAMLFVAPGALLIIALAMLHASLAERPLVATGLAGLQAAVLAVVLHALIALARRALPSRSAKVIAVLAFVAVGLIGLPFPVMLAAAALGGMFALRDGPSTPPAPHATNLPAPRPGWTLKVLAAGALALLVPLGLLHLLAPGMPAQLAILFSELALFSFGGAYALLAWMIQEVVQTQGWLALPDMMSGLALAEATPGPLVLITVFTGYLASAGAEGHVLAGLGGAAIALWFTFVPALTLILAAAPHVSRLGEMPRLRAALRGISAAVVGVIASLSLWFGLRVLFARMQMVDLGAQGWVAELPDPASLQPVAMAIAGLAVLALGLWRLSLPLVLAMGAAISVLARVLLGA